ncbi:hypothetical protein LOCC1_G005725 [Lachnellula occidentalis]|uniref:Spo12-like protein n=1 Tax=Lachnellula occidentalis TaxID=215460 RepID=A0A8H8UD60_9HELO|nr:hypothetical protein LOCC1_G005725 [Lachnellula occidentalis]
MSSNVLADKDINASATTGAPADGAMKDAKSMEYHRQVLQSKLEEGQGKETYVSPSDTIMSPCTAKLSAYRSKQVGKTKPKSLFAKTSAKNLGVGENMFGSQIPRASSEKNNEDQQ